MKFNFSCFKSILRTYSFLLLFLVPQITWSKTGLCREFLAEKALVENALFTKTKDYLKSIENFLPTYGSPFEYILGSGGEGVATLLLRQRNAKVIRSVRKDFTGGLTFSGVAITLELFGKLRKLKTQDLLPGFELPKIYSANYNHEYIYLEYIPGINISHIYTEQRTHGIARVQNKQNLNSSDLKVLRLFSDRLEKVAQAWKRSKNVEAELHAEIIMGERYYTYLEILDKDTFEILLDISAINTVYDYSKNRLVIIDPQ